MQIFYIPGWGGGELIIYHRQDYFLHSTPAEVSPTQVQGFAHPCGWGLGGSRGSVALTQHSHP